MSDKYKCGVCKSTPAFICGREDCPLTGRNTLHDRIEHLERVDAFHREIIAEKAQRIEELRELVAVLQAGIDAEWDERQDQLKEARSLCEYWRDEAGDKGWPLPWEINDE